jgi:hypothetical protein
MKDPRSPLAVLLAFLFLFLGGGALGLGLAEALAPGSWTAQAVSLFAFPVAFAVSLQAWYGLALIGLIPRLLANLRSRGSRVRERSAAEPVSLPGAFVFLPVTSALGAFAGLVVGLVSATQPLWVVAPVYWLTGTLHGALAWRLARQGLLLPPESV